MKKCNAFIEDDAIFPMTPPMVGHQTILMTHHQSYSITIKNGITNLTRAMTCAKNYAKLL